MRLKTTLLSGCAVLFCATAAHAGELQANIQNINNFTGTGAGGVNPVLEMDTDLAPNPQFPDTDRTTVETGPVELSEARDFNVALGKYMPAHFEVNLDDIVPDLNIVPGNNNMIITIDLTGPAQWKQDFSPAEIIRAGEDDVDSQGAFGSLIKAGEKTATFSFDAAEGGETDIGFMLPIALTECAATFVQFTITDPDLPGQARSLEQPLQLTSCGEDAVFISNFISPKDLEVDYDLEDPFELFLDDVQFPGDSSKGVGLFVDDDFGVIDFKVKNALFSLKAKDLLSAGERTFRYVDASDIATYSIGFEFKDATGIAGVGFTTPGCPAGPGPSGVYPPINDVVTITMTGAEVISCFDLDQSTIGPNGKQEGAALLFILSAQNGAIKTQDVDVVNYSIVLDETPGFTGAQVQDPEGDPSPRAMLSADGNVIETLVNYEEDNGEDAFRIVRSGLIFGPFDWVNDNNNRESKSAFRVTGLPKLEDRDEHGNVKAGTVEGLTEYRGAVILNKSSKGIEGACEFTVREDLIEHGETVIYGGALDEILSGGGARFTDVHCAGPLGMEDFGRADVTWTWFVPVEESQEADMDRLLWNPELGVAADYGDNGNDGFSLKARSCDSGRFGPHTANNLSETAADLLTFVCGLGASVADDDI
ncbi:MAG: hypothetical protein AAFX08_06730 [Pseudomonadota bacterium]